MMVEFEKKEYIKKKTGGSMYFISRIDSTKGGHMLATPDFPNFFIY
jgi:hypothetical protein